MLLPTSPADTPAGPPDRRSARLLDALLLLLPFAGLLAVPLYNRETPSLLGFPFFFWYLFAWVPLTSGLIAFVNRRRDARGEE